MYIVFTTMFPLYRSIQKDPRKQRTVKESIQICKLSPIQNTFQTEDCDNNGLDLNSLSKYKTSILNRYLSDSVESVAKPPPESESTAVSRTPEPQQINLDSKVLLEEPYQTKTPEAVRKRPLSSTNEKAVSKKVKVSSEPLSAHGLIQSQPSFLFFPPFSSPIDQTSLRPGFCSLLLG